MIQILPPRPPAKRGERGRQIMQDIAQGAERYKHYSDKASMAESLRGQGFPENYADMPATAQKAIAERLFSSEKPKSESDILKEKLLQEKLNYYQSNNEMVNEMMGKPSAKESPSFRDKIMQEGEREEEIPTEFDITSGKKTPVEPKKSTKEIQQPYNAQDASTWSKQQVSERRKLRGNKDPRLAVLGQQAEDEYQDRKSKEEKAEKKQTEAEKKTEANRIELNKEVLPIKQEILKKADSARQSIENKEKLLDLIDTGEIDDPTYAALAEAIPLNLGKRLLSPETVQYKSGLIDEFKDLRNIFQGQTRVKEIDLLEAKIADIYLTDEQKKSVLRSRIDANKVDLLYEEAAQELEDEGKPLGLLQYKKELEKKVKPKKEALFNRILDEQKSIIQNAENRKKTKLDFSDPEDAKIIEQIAIEAGGNKAKTKELAKKKGYTF